MNTFHRFSDTEARLTAISLERDELKKSLNITGGNAWQKICVYIFTNSKIIVALL